MGDSSAAGFVGIMLVGADVQSEGAHAVLANVTERAGADAVAIGATVAEPAPQGQGVFQPPADAGASVRLFDRPLWGRRSLWMRSAPAWTPRLDHYRRSPYQPRPSTRLTQEAGPVLADFVRVAAESGLGTYIQLGAVSPPGLREADMPRLPNGNLPDRMVNTASLASPAVRAWNRARARDALDAFPGLTGLRLDYVEDPCYKLPEAFTDFSVHAERWCAEHGLNFAAIQADVAGLYSFLCGGLTDADLEELLARPAEDAGWILERFPAAHDWTRLKGALSTDLIADWQATVAEHTGPEVEVAVNAFASPMAVLTGFDVCAAAKIASSVAPKLYAMHWSMMVEFWAQELLAHNPGLSEELVVRALVRFGDLADDDVPVRIADYGYPEPDEAHPVPDGPFRRKIEHAIRDADGAAPVYPIVHGYGPPEDFRRRLQVVADCGADGVWVNRYGYLSDEKLDAIGEVWAGRRPAA